MLTFCIVIPTFNASNIWVSCLEAIESQTAVATQTLVIDSSSTDQTAKIAQEYGWELLSIDKSEFGHGKTRQFALELIDDCEIAIFLTQDACLEAGDAIEKLLLCFEDEKIGSAYGRQLARPEAGAIERFERAFNYSSISSLKSIDESSVLGLKTVFISNSFAAYRISALRDVGGFPVHTILAEDMYVGAKMILAGCKIAYCSEAAAYHSHNYSIVQTFQRYFDTGVFHSREAWIRKNFGGAESEGLKYVRAEFLHLLRHDFRKIPIAFLKNCFKFIGYNLGLREKFLPIAFKRKLSMHTSYWESGQ